MSTSPVTSAPPLGSQQQLKFQVLAAFCAIYFIWGSTFLAIRVVVSTVPPLFAAGVRFAIAGTALFLWSALRGIPMPSCEAWRNLTILGALMFLAAYSGLFWAETRLPSGIASVLVATIPVWTALFEIFIFKKQRLRLALVLAICLGLAGVSLLASNRNGERFNVLACLAILGSEIAWSFGTVLSKEMVLPNSKQMSAACQMMTGGVMLLVFSAVAGELRTSPHVSAKAGLALGYLIVAGSLLAFTAYVWLLGRMPATSVASYAYVNPVIALAIGYWLGHETLDFRTVIGATLILLSVLLILVKRNERPREPIRG